MRVVLAGMAGIPILIGITILAVFIYEASFFFREVSIIEFFTDTQWTPQFKNPHFGIAVLAVATLTISTIALAIAIPLGIFAAIYLSEYASPQVRSLLKPSLEALSGIPTIVFGYFALLVVTPFLRRFFPDIDPFNSLSAGLVTGVLIVPIISSIGEDAMRNVPRSLREGAYALGFTKREVIWRVILPVSFPGIVAAVTLAASRALGETMIASTAAGQNPRLTFDPLKAVESVTAYIIQVSLGQIDPFTFHTVFTVGFVLFAITLTLNWLGRLMVRRYRRSMAGLSVPVVEPGSIELEKPALAEVAESTDRDDVSLHVLQQTFYPAFGRRGTFDRVFAIATFVTALLGVFVFLVLFVTILHKGWAELDLHFLTNVASRKVDRAGILAALAGSAWLLLLAAILAFPVGIGAAIFLEEYLPQNRFSYLLEIYLANLTAVPSILYGLLGLALFARLGEPLTGGTSLLSASLVLAAIVLPITIVTTRAALQEVPQSQRHAAYAVGMTRWQAIWQSVLPSAWPGILTGLLLSLSRAIGETSPLIAIGAVSFAASVPSPSIEGLQGKFASLPTQIFYWVQQPKFQDLAAATILVLGAIVLFANIIAVLLRDAARRGIRA